MFPDQRLKTATAKVLSVSMLIVVSGALSGFSSLKTKDKLFVIQRDSGTTRSITEITKSAPRLRSGTSGLQRPASFEHSLSLEAVLGEVDVLMWFDLKEQAHEQADSHLQTRQIGEFRGIGFPDIRTFRNKTRRYNPLNPQPWAPMISWHKRNGDNRAAEPIALIRCMGLSPQAVEKRAGRYDQMIRDNAAKYKISASLVKAVIAAESCFNTQALSPVGAQGLMQLMPKTASWLQVADPYNPEENIRGGTRYLAALREQFDTIELALAAYNAGPGNVRRYGGVPPFKETREYVKRVKAHYRRYAAAMRLASR